MRTLCATVLSIAFLALTGCAGRLGYTAEPFTSATVKKKPKVELQLSEPWAKPCKYVDMKPGEYRAVITDRDGNIQDVIYEVEIYSEKVRRCRLHLDLKKNTTVYDRRCNRTPDELSSSRLRRRISGEELVEWGFAGPLREKLGEGQGCVCLINLIESEDRKATRWLVDRYIRTTPTE